MIHTMGIETSTKNQPIKAIAAAAEAKCSIAVAPDQMHQRVARCHQTVNIASA
jgi:hypothetical protein